MLEFYITPDGEDIMVQEDGRHYLLTEDDSSLVSRLYKIIKSRYPDTYNRLNDIYAKSPYFMYLAVKRFIKCNWANSDEKADINGDIWNLEKVHCPLRGGFCKDEGIICMPRMNVGLTPKEKDILKLIKLPNKLIADQSFCSIHTIENHIANILKKLNLHSKTELLEYAKDNNIN
jgi:DNA-binding CsgD family transcriptional regulator